MTFLNKQAFILKPGSKLIALSSLIWILSFSSSFFINPKDILEKEDSGIINDLKTNVENDKKITVVGIILKQNIKVCLLLFCGIFLYGIPTIITLVFNGFITGSILRDIIIYNSLSNKDILFKTLPHFSELLGFWISGAVGLMGIIWFNRLIRENTLPDKSEIKKISVMMLSSVTIVIISGFIEVYISMK